MVNLIDKDFVVLSPDKNASIEPFDSGLYQRLDSNYQGFKGHELISCYEFSDDWTSWEMHPEGDEVVVLMSGNATLILQLETGEKSLRLDQPGAYAIVPKKVWHRAKTGVTTKMLFITPGEGTQHRQVD